jgi:hypothetical protein
MNLTKLHNAIANVCPINGVSTGSENDKTTWSFDAAESATAEQIATAQAIIDNADLSILDDVKYIPKLAIIDRLIALGKLSDAMTALNSDATKKARWDAATEIRIDDADVIAVLAALVIEPSTVLY